MRNLKRPVRWVLGLYLFALVALLSVAVILHRANPPAARPPSQAPGRLTPVNAHAYVGDETCAACHQKQVSGYHRTAHYVTSASASKESIHGKFTPGSNILRTADTNLLYQMDLNEAGAFQSAVRRVSPEKVGHRTERFDLVFGSGRKGQTYAFWKDDLLFQLPVSFWTELDGWVNSPGYPDGIAVFTRPISPRCLECHAPTFESLAPPGNRYQKSSLVLGLTCEKCHGPVGEHVARYRSASPPKSRADSAIINAATFSRERQMDACALCHGGGGTPTAPSLSFVPGDVLKKFLDFPKRDPNERVDVHGSQVFLLEPSQCYHSNATITCSKCPNVHPTD